MFIKIGDLIIRQDLITSVRPYTDLEDGPEIFIALYGDDCMWTVFKTVEERDTELRRVEEALLHTKPLEGSTRPPPASQELKSALILDRVRNDLG